VRDPKNAWKVTGKNRRRTHQWRAKLCQVTEASESRWLLGKERGWWLWSKDAGGGVRHDVREGSRGSDQKT
jgi:hypothetical protein